MPVFALHIAKYSLSSGSTSNLVKEKAVASAEQQLLTSMSLPDKYIFQHIQSYITVQDLSKVINITANYIEDRQFQGSFTI